MLNNNNQKLNGFYSNIDLKNILLNKVRTIKIPDYYCYDNQFSGSCLCENDIVNLDENNNTSFNYKLKQIYDIDKYLYCTFKYVYDELKDLHDNQLSYYYHQLLCIVESKIQLRDHEKYCCHEERQIIERKYTPPVIRNNIEPLIVDLVCKITQMSDDINKMIESIKMLTREIVDVKNSQKQIYEIILTTNNIKNIYSNNNYSFICHSGKNKSVAILISKYLKQIKEQPWIDLKDINEKTEDSIYNNIKNCKYFIIIETEELIQK